MASLIRVNELKKQADTCAFPVCHGKVTGAGAVCVQAVLPGARVGSRVVIERSQQDKVHAEVVACEGTRVELLPLATTTGIGPGDRVTLTADQDVISCSSALLGRVIDPMGMPLDGGKALPHNDLWPLDRAAPDPLARKPISELLVTGVRAIDGCLSLGLGQRIGLFAGPGLGKSTLLGTLAKRAQCDACVICLVGERGREVRAFLDQTLGPKGLAKSAVVLATADAPLLVRARAMITATAVAEWFRSQGRHVLLLVDSLTRAVRARRDIALALGDAPARNGFPAASFATLPGLVERTGRDAVGSITAIYTVLTEGDSGDPIAEEARSLLDGHIVLSAKRARAGQWPAIDITRSVSRVMDVVVSPEHRMAARHLKRLLGAYEEQEDLILMGAYCRGTSSDTDLALDRKDQIDAFLRQNSEDSPSSLKATIGALADITRGM
ncbi:MAG: FliI/YscN family ATPase [Myxococcota bacterium]|nr:FliI/YscN family ATPase [Myxococcota bacterium]